MNRREEEIIAADIRRQWPRRVELPDEELRGTENCAGTWGLAKELGAAPYPLSAMTATLRCSISRLPRTPKLFTRGSVASCCRSRGNTTRAAATLIILAPSR
jgi:hypothetical protein